MKTNEEILATIVKKIELNESRYENDPIFAIWLIHENVILDRIYMAIKNGTISEEVDADIYGELWETWMTLNGNSEDI